MKQKAAQKICPAFLFVACEMQARKFEVLIPFTASS
jgi:hypothetical protein